MGMIGDLAGHRVYFDANVFIYALERFPRYVAVASDLLEASDAGLFQTRTSELSLAEVTVGPIRARRPDPVQAFEAALLPTKHFETVPITRGILLRSAGLRASLGGRLPDAIHCATALETACSHVVSADRGLKVPSQIELILLDDLIANGNG